MQGRNIRLLVFSGLLIALGIIMPFFTAQIPSIGSKLLPMHLPVLISGYVCGWYYGLAVGFITPLLRSIMYTMPPLFPTATAMAFELAAYGALTGLFYKFLPKKSKYIYVSLISSMLLGRVVWGLASHFLLAAKGNAFTFTAFMAGAFINAIPGIILQIIIIPPLIMLLQKARLTFEGK